MSFNSLLKGNNLKVWNKIYFGTCSLEMNPLRHMYQVFTRLHHICDSLYPSRKLLITFWVVWVLCSFFTWSSRMGLPHLHLVFQNRPSTWSHVDGLCICDQNISFTGSDRVGEAPRTLVAAPSHQLQIQVKMILPKILILISPIYLHLLLIKCVFAVRNRDVLIRTVSGV
jgi:hypothetical protein